MTRRLVQALLIVIAFALPEAVFAQNRQSAKGTAEQAVSKRDREFVMRAAHSNSAEIVMGQLAQKNGASEAVRQTTLRACSRVQAPARLRRTVRRTPSSARGC